MGPRALTPPASSHVIAQEFLSSNLSPLPTLPSVWQDRKGSPVAALLVSGAPEPSSLLCCQSSAMGLFRESSASPTQSPKPSPWIRGEDPCLPIHFSPCSQGRELGLMLRSRDTVGLARVTPQGGRGDLQPLPTLSMPMTIKAELTGL